MIDKSLKQHETPFIIRDMKDGESGYTVSWAMQADSNGSLYIHADFPCYPTSGGTVSMHITKTPYGMEVDIRGCSDAKWPPHPLTDGIEWWPVCTLLHN